MKSTKNFKVIIQDRKIVNRAEVENYIRNEEGKARERLFDIVRLDNYITNFYLKFGNFSEKDKKGIEAELSQYEKNTGGYAIYHTELKIAYKNKGFEILWVRRRDNRSYLGRKNEQIELSDRQVKRFLQEQGITTDYDSKVGKELRIL